MKGYTFNPQIIDHHLKSYKGKGKMVMMDLRELKVRMPDKSIINIEETPHFKYCNGNQEPYKDFLKQWFRQDEYQSSLNSLEYLMTDDHYYLEGKHSEDYIRCGQDLVIRDGVHRAARLVHLRVQEVPVIIED